MSHSGSNKRVHLLADVVCQHRLQLLTPHLRERERCVREERGEGERERCVRERREERERESGV